ncbi:PAS domain-containing sensor histidine kinase [Flavobacterium antarcticum]|uniref:sensor histidine kinase n=1 Tax=Flavobacterium antarcticum TaxID=271155 RepID=UPI0003B5C70D|nr:HAMP domain-containing sensor histidine kinase [Flavobacterium antarcticum]
MQFSEQTNKTRWIIIAASFVIVTLILWNTYDFFQVFKSEERQKMEILAESLQKINKSDPTVDDLALELSIISSNLTIPFILTDNEGAIINNSNIEPQISENPEQLSYLLSRFKKQNEAIIMEDSSQYLYYGNSSLLTKLKYYPLALVLIIVLFGIIVYNFYRSTKIGTQNKLWAGMAKETAHQIGTPLSSLIGWVEIMKADNVDETTVSEIEKDISRLQTITDRFSKIGSEPVLERINIVKETEDALFYLKARFSKQVNFSFTGPDYPVLISLNPGLHSWTIENLVKNAIDAMKGKGDLTVAIIDDNKYIRIRVSDTGKGIPKKDFTRVFEPGFTTKKRGWGLGLSLTKRIAEEYHNGNVKVLSSEIGKGTCIQMSFKIT